MASVSHHQPDRLGGGRVLSVAVLRSRGQPVREPSVCNAVPPQSGDHTGVQVHTQVCRHKGADVYTERACRLAHTQEYVCSHRTCAAMVSHRDCVCATVAGIRVCGLGNAANYPPPMPLKHMYVAHTCVCMHAYKASAIHRVPPTVQIQAKITLARARLPI